VQRRRDLGDGEIADGDVVEAHGLESRRGDPVEDLGQIEQGRQSPVAAGDGHPQPVERRDGVPARRECTLGHFLRRPP
jgi:hypothetical protein